MGIGVPSVCQVLVNQGLLVLSSCLQEHFQAHRLQWDLGLRLENRTELSPQAQRHLSQLSRQSSPAHWSCLILAAGNSEWEVLRTYCSCALVHMLKLNPTTWECDRLGNDSHYTCNYIR